jgi:MoaA/NifB/PqqE/SkfB family radical SAM enzyme
MPLVALDLVPPPREWIARFGSWRGNIFEVDPALAADAPILTSPDFELEGAKLVTLCFSAYFGGGATFRLHIVEQARGKKVHSRLYRDVAGETRMSVAFRAPATGKYRLVLDHVNHPVRARIAIAAPAFLAQGIGDGRVVRGRVADLGQTREDSEDERYLPHWNGLQRYIHRRCRASRGFNRLVAAVEMRLERQELLSLPQYMGLCPTGQCNATCDFCSVTINRTGIIKKQLPFERLDSFLAPVANTIQLFGIEGNGEPTLYTRFPELVERLTRGGAKAYLITNGSRLRPDDASLLLALDAVNFSLNAATAETHRRVMKLKNFDEITAVIRSLTRERGVPLSESAPEPSVYVTFVVTNDNVHEVQDFVRMAEQDLKVDTVMVRPLAELGNELGTVEDLRAIVPFESDIKDMIDSVQEYALDTAGTTEIRIAPDTFRSSRPDPVGRVAMPRGFEKRLLAPRRNDWRALHSDVAVVWNLNAARIMLPPAKETLLRSEPIPVEPGRELTFKAQIGVNGGSVRMSIADDDDRTVVEVLLADTGGRMIPVELLAPTGQGGSLSIVLAGEGRASTIQIDFERLRTPAPYVSNEFHVPRSCRWEICTPGAQVTWDSDALALRSPNGGMPYLIKSYAVPCARNTIIEIPVQVDASTGLIEIGILDASGEAYLQTFSFAQGRTSSVIFFDTGANDAVRLVVSAPPDHPVDATIHWGQARIVLGDEGETVSIRLPSAPEWAACVPAVRIDRSDDERLSMSWRGMGSPYLLKSNKIRCRRGQQVKTPIAVEVREGELGVGVVGAEGAGWLARETLGEGTYHVDLDFNTAANDEVSFVLFAVEGASVVAKIGNLDNAPANDLAPPPLAIDFDRWRMPSLQVTNEFRIPPGGRWEVCAPGAHADWDDTAVRLRSGMGGRPYLLKSCAIRCAQNTIVEIPVQIDVLSGPIEIGILNASGGSHLQTFSFAEGRTVSSIFFDTGANSAVRLLVSATPDQPVDAAIRWDKPRLVSEDDENSVSAHPPRAPEWAVCVPAVRLKRSNDRLSLSWQGAGSPYLLKSNKVRYRPGQQATAPMAIEVTDGQLGVGVLDAEGAEWLMTQTLGEGNHRVDLAFHTGANHQVSFVLFAVNGAAVAASVAFPEDGLVSDMVPARAILDDRAEELVTSEATTQADLGALSSQIVVSGIPSVSQAEIVVMAAVESSTRQIVADMPIERSAPLSPTLADAGQERAQDVLKRPPDRLLRQATKWARGGARYYCQKPWTDMNNFTVDGRMDVCCIATGASQEGYQLGNINRQSFQETWNGPMAREFRRTVNGDHKLPPCARCPMSHAYTGFLFHPEYTREAINVRVFKVLQKLKLRWLINSVGRMNAYLVDRILFRGFRNEKGRII